MTTRDALSIAIPTGGLLVVLLLPGMPRWSRAPWFARAAARRGLLAAFFIALLFVAVIHLAA